MYRSDVVSLKWKTHWQRRDRMLKRLTAPRYRYPPVFKVTMVPGRKWQSIVERALDWKKFFQPKIRWRRTKMDLREARRILTPPLVFGDDRQIRAHEFLVKVEEAKEKIRACAHDDHRFSRADKWNVARCSCIVEFSDEVRIAAAEDFAAENGDK